MTHYTRSKVDTGLLGRITSANGGTPAEIAEVDAAATARRAYEVWQEMGTLRACGDQLCAAVREILERFSEQCGRRLPVRVAMVDFAAGAVVAATESEWVTA
jgi:cobalt-precorrin-5B (C1)-methyltransferase